MNRMQRYQAGQIPLITPDMLGWEPPSANPQAGPISGPVTPSEPIDPEDDPGPIGGELPGEGPIQGPVTTSLVWGLAGLALGFIFAPNIRRILGG